MTMQFIKSTSELQDILKLRRQFGSSIGFVPTMGALHAGHASLIQKAVQENDCVVTSIFINPKQFSANEDFDRYPRTLEQDRVVVANAGGHILFYPDVDEIYPESFSTFVEESHLSLPLCGASRIGHFKGVTTVIARLFGIIGPCRAYFGLKDLQQFLVVKKMIQDLCLPVQITGCPTIRETDGLAMSSRNRYLDAEQRKRALSLINALQDAYMRLQQGYTLSEAMVQAQDGYLRLQVDKIDYFECRYLLDLSLVDGRHKIDDLAGKAALFVAAYIGQTRLIDNLIL